MAKLKLTIACIPTDRSRPLLDGRVQIEDCEIEPLNIEPEEIFRRALNEKAFHLTELSMSSHIVTTARGDAAYTAVPVFLSRVFRHSAMFVRTDRGIKSPADLAGRVIGVPEYQQTAGMWVRGILRDRYGLDTTKITWRTGGQEKAGSVERIALDLPSNIHVKPISPTQTLNGMLANGEIDAIFTPRPPSCFVEKSAPVDRLFPNYRDAEMEYFRQTRFFPIMHTLCVRKDIAEANPWLPARLFTAFAKAKALALNDLTQTNVLRVALPWAASWYKDARTVMGDNIWPYGFRENRDELAAMTRYSHEDGLAARALDPAELFHPSTLELADKA
ncbi:MAG: ABC transporter substrate-binding protein [Rhizobiales bacterium]|nr:ABC transporter substrate-binding protein [Hyphomicrobiales bacterium]